MLIIDLQARNCGAQSVICGGDGYRINPFAGYTIVGDAWYKENIQKLKSLEFKEEPLAATN
jgi:hypothetical protein